MNTFIVQTFSACKPTLIAVLEYNTAINAVNIALMCKFDVMMIKGYFEILLDNKLHTNSIMHILYNKVANTKRFILFPSYLLAQKKRNYGK